MSEQADRGTPLRLREPVNLVSPRARLMWLAEGALFMLVLLAVQAGWWFIDGRGSRTPHLVVGGAWLVFAVLYLSIMPVWRYRVHRWEVTDEAVYTRSGWLTRTWTLVPISRIQTVDVTRGVLQQLFGLASVAVLTASAQGTVRVQHLEADVAQRVADDLAHRAEQVRDQAT